MNNYLAVGNQEALLKKENLAWTRADILQPKLGLDRQSIILKQKQIKMDA